MALELTPLPDLNYLAIQGLAGLRPRGIARIRFGLRHASEGSSGGPTVFRTAEAFVVLDDTLKRIRITFEGSLGVNGYLLTAEIWGDGPRGSFKLVQGSFNPPERVQPYSRVTVIFTIA